MQTVSPGGDPGSGWRVGSGARPPWGAPPRDAETDIDPAAPVSSHLPWLCASWCLSEHVSTGCLCVCVPTCVCACPSVHVHTCVISVCACMCLAACRSVDVLGTLPSQRCAERRHCQPGCGLPQLHKHIPLPSSREVQPAAMWLAEGDGGSGVVLLQPGPLHTQSARSDP